MPLHSVGFEPQRHTTMPNACYSWVAATDVAPPKRVLLEFLSGFEQASFAEVRTEFNRI